VQSLQTDADGRITAVAQGIDPVNIDGKKVTLVPTDSSGNPLVYNGSEQAVFRWVCGSPALGTDIPSKFLPASCRG
jgi:hypothetical protein